MAGSWAGAAALIALGALAGAARAESWPARPVRFIVPFTPAGPSDALARLAAEHLTRTLGQQVVVDNRPGAGGNIGLDAAARASADGYTLLLGAQSTLAVNPALYRRQTVDVDRDFQPVALLARFPYLMLTHPGLPAKTLAEFLAAARAKPGQMSFGSSGIGTTSHIAAKLLERVARLDLVHVPYKGDAPALGELMGGQIHLFFSLPAGSAPHVRAGRLRALAVAAPTRTPLLPDLPTAAEAGLPGFEATTWFGVMTRRGVPPAIVARLNAELNRGLGLEDTRGRLAALGAEAQPRSVEDFAAHIRSERDKWGRVVREAGITID